MKVFVIQRARFKGDSHKAQAVIEVGGILFFSVTPESAADAEKINAIFADAVIKPKGLKWIPKT